MHRFPCLCGFRESAHAYTRWCLSWTQVQGWTYDSNWTNWYISKEFMIGSKRESFGLSVGGWVISNGKTWTWWPYFLSCGLRRQRKPVCSEKEERGRAREYQRLRCPGSVGSPVPIHSRSPALFLSLSSKTHPSVLIINSSFLLKLT